MEVNTEYFTLKWEAYLHACHVVIIFHTAHPRQDIHQVALNFRMTLTDRPDPNSYHLNRTNVFQLIKL